MRDKFTSFKEWADDTDVHLKKYVPLHVASFMFDSLHSNTTKGKEQ